MKLTIDINFITQKETICINLLPKGMSNENIEYFTATIYTFIFVAGRKSF